MKKPNNNNKYCTLYIIRHGQSEANYPRDLYGLDTKLTQKGKIQAKEAAKRFKNVTFDKIIASPLIRAQETAEIIAKEHNLEVLTKEALRDRHFGVIEGRSTKEVQHELEELFKLRNKLPFNKWKDKKFVDGYESDAQMISRFITALREIAIAYPGKQILVVSHVSIIRTFLIHLGLKSYKYFASYTFENAGYIKLKTDGIDFFVEEIYGIKKKT